MRCKIGTWDSNNHRGERKSNSYDCERESNSYDCERDGNNHRGQTDAVIVITASARRGTAPPSRLDAHRFHEAKCRLRELMEAVGRLRERADGVRLVCCVQA